MRLPRTICRDTGKIAVATISTIAGAAGGISAAQSGATTGAEIGVAIRSSLTWRTIAIDGGQRARPSSAPAPAAPLLGALRGVATTVGPAQRRGKSVRKVAE